MHHSNQFEAKLSQMALKVVDIRDQLGKPLDVSPE